MKKKRLIFTILSVTFLLLTLNAAAVENCSPSGTLSGTYTCSDDMTTYSTTTVEDGDSVTFSSSASITLKPGFWAKEGSTFSASLDLDSDNDGILDIWEITHFGTVIYDENYDPDGDGVTNYWEFMLGLDPNLEELDSDNDGMPDWYEVQEYQTLDNGEQTGDCDCD